MKAMIAIVGVLMLSPVAMAAAPQSKPPGAISCIDPQRIEGQSAEGDDTIVFRMGTRTYRNRLASACPGLARLNTFGSLATEPWSGQLCEGDSIRVFDQSEARTTGLAGSPRCRLGWFEPVQPAHP